MATRVTQQAIRRFPNTCKFSTLSELRAQIKSESDEASKDAGQSEETELNLPTSKYKFGPLNESQKAYLDRVIRVDQAGELGADYIYAGQYLVLSTKEPALKDILKHMWEQEIFHHGTFNNLQVKNRVRPSLLTPLWKLGAFSMGVGTALIGKEAAMACTVAVETVIGGHYNDQLRVLTNKYDIPVFDKETGERIDDPSIKSEELGRLLSTIKQFRDDELEHLDTAVEHDAEKAVPYWLLTEGIKLICKGAIWTSERV